MKTIKQIFGRLTAACVFAFVLTSNVYGQPSPPNPGGINIPPTPEQIEAARQAWLAALNAESTNNFAPWIHGNEMGEFGLPMSSSFASWQNEGTAGLLSLGTALGNWQADQAIAATNFSQTVGWPLTVTNDNSIAIMVGTHGDMSGYIGTYNLNAVDTVGSEELWTNGSSGLNLNNEGRKSPFGILAMLDSPIESSPRTEPEL